MLPDGVQQFTVRNVNINSDYLSVYGIKLLAGRNLSRTRGEDAFPDPDAKNNPNANILINAAAARLFGFTPEKAVGQIIFYGRARGQMHHRRRGGRHQFRRLADADAADVHFYYPKALGPLSVRIRPGQTQAALAAIDRHWHRFVPTHHPSPLPG